MKIRIYTLVFCLAFHINTYSQTTISGIVTDSLNKPIPFANVYLAKTTYSTVTDQKGYYSLSVKEDGYYQMIASCVGFHSYEYNFISDGLNHKLNIRLSVDYVNINEVTILSDEKIRQKLYALFVEFFIGTTENSAKCKILNPNDLHIYKDSEENILHAFSIKPLRIENKALGYNIIYDLKEFSYNSKINTLRYSGNYYFQPMKGSERKMRMWDQNRLLAYKGSTMHFIRTLFEGNFTKENFAVYEHDNAGKENEEIKYVNDVNPNSDSIKIQNDTIPHLEYSDIVSANNSYSKYFFYEKPLSIIYMQIHKFGADENLRTEYLSVLTSSNFTTNSQNGFYNHPVTGYKSVILASRPATIYQNGFYEHPYDITWKGRMAKERIANMLPFDYQPDKTESSQNYDNNTDFHEDQVFVQTDRNLYFPGDTIYFQAYIRDKQSGKFETKTNALYALLFNEQNEKVDGSRFKIEEFSSGWISIPKNARPGKYRFVAFTSMMQNGRPNEAFQLDLRVAATNKASILNEITYNKENYLPGDTAQITITLSKLLTNQKLFCKLLNGKSELNHYKSISNENGKSTIQFVLPDTLSSASKLEIETINNSDTIINQFNIPFKKQYINLRFLPEGGNLISGIEQKIGFNATDINGETLMIEGLLKNKDGKILDTIASGIYGPGKFDIVPENGMFVELIKRNYEKNIWPLPKLDNSYLCLSVTPWGNRMVVIDAKSNKNSLDSATIKVTMNDKELMSKTFIIKELKRITLTTDSLPTGVLKITLFDLSMKPVAERLVYINPDLHLKFEIKSDTAEYHPGQETQLTIKAYNEDDSNEPCIFSIAVVDSISGHDGNLFAPGIEYSLNYHPYLFKNLPDKVLIDGIENIDNQQRDLLMMVYGWTKYNCKYQISKSNKDYEIMNISIPGPKIGVANKKLELLELDALIVKKIVTDQKGEIALRFDSLLNTTNWFLIMPDEKARHNYTGPINLNYPQNEVFFNAKSFSDQLPVFQSESTVNNQYQETNLLNDSAIKIPEVTIKALAKREYFDKYQEMYSSSQSTGYEKLWSFKTLEDAIRFVAHPYKIDDDGIILRSSENNYALFVLDGFQLGSAGFVRTISPSNLSSITVIDGTDGYSQYGESGRGGVIFLNSIYQNRNPEIAQRYRVWLSENKQNMMFVPYNIYRIYKEFYNPHKTELDSNPYFQKRQTALWKPFVYFNGKDPVIIKYPNLHRLGPVMITINGVSTNNLMGTGKLSYKVQ